MALGIALDWWSSKVANKLMVRDKSEISVDVAAPNDPL
jgi:hypothetical protein